MSTSSQGSASLWPLVQESGAHPAVRRGRLLLLLMVLLLAAGCRREPTPEPPPTATRPASGLSPVEPTASPSAVVATTATAMPATTPAPRETAPLTTETPFFATNMTLTPGTATATVDPATLGQGEQVGLYVSYTLDEEAQEAGQRAVVVVASVENKGDNPLVVGEASLTMVGSDGVVYRPEPAAATNDPPLLGAEVAPGDSFLGLIKFIIPADVSASRLQWCPDGGLECEAPVSAPIP